MQQIDLTDVGNYTFDGDDIEYIINYHAGDCRVITKVGYFDFKSKQELLNTGRLQPKPKWKPEVGKVYWFWDDYEEDGCGSVYERTKIISGVFVDKCGTEWDNCRPLKDEEIGK